MSYIEHLIRIHSVIKYVGRFAPVENMQEALKLVISQHINAEIIGNWLYCFTSPLIGVQLQGAGFWYSYKHNAYIYTGHYKDNFAFIQTLDEIRARHGSQKVKEGEYYV
jgi:hypothetical protein